MDNTPSYGYTIVTYTRDGLNDAAPQHECTHAHTRNICNLYTICNLNNTARFVHKLPREL